MARMVHLLTGPFDPGALQDSFTLAHPGAGAMCSFLGLVRGEGEGERRVTAGVEAGVEALELMHYDKLTLPGMEALADEAIARFGLLGMLVVHRSGVMHAGEPIVLVAASACHRRAAIEAVDFAMDHLKSAAWFWKREKRAGSWQWIEPREEDHLDLARWK